MTSNTNDEFSTSEIAKVLTAMTENFRKSDEDEYGHLYAAHFPKSVDSGGKAPTPREFSSAFLEESQIKHTLADIAVNQIGVPKERRWRAAYIYNNYSFLKPFISALVSQFEGGSCSVDKTHWLMGHYIKLQKTDGVSPISSTDEQRWYTPQNSSIPMWIAVLDELPYFQNGKYKKLPAILENLENHYASM